MKKVILQRLSTIIAVMLVIPLTVIAVVASITNATNEEKTDENQPVVTRNKIVNGLYRFDGEFTLQNITYFADENEVFAYFQTNDKNGVDKAAIDMDIFTFANALKKVDDEEKFIEFATENSASSYKQEDGEYVLVNETEFEFEYNGTEYISTGLNPIIKADEENKTVTLYFPFYIENDDGTKEVTPLYVEAKLVYVEAR